MAVIMIGDALQTLFKQPALMWEGLIRPNPKITKREQKQHARLLSGMLIVASLVLSLIVIIVGLLDARDLTSSAVIVAYVTITWCLVLYFINRAGYFMWARRLFIIYFGVVLTALAYIDGTPSGILPFAVIPVMLVGIYYPGKWIYVAATIVLITTFLLNQMMYTSDHFWDLQVGWYFLIFACGLSIVFVHHKYTLEKIHIQNLEDANYQLRESEQLLEQRVAERTAELQQAYEEMEALNHIKDEFVSNVSHELRTPISSIKLQMYLLKQTSVPQQEKYINVLNRETDRLNNSIESLLQLSRLDQDHHKLDFKKINLNELVEQYVADRKILAETKQLTLQSMPEVEDGVWILGDANLIGQVLSILLTNAFNYTPNGGCITVTASIISEHNAVKWGQLSIQDTGIGIAPDEQAKLFTRFYRGNAAIERKISGTGLGLSIAKAIVDTHHGRISVHSTGIPGEGTNFNIQLPLTK